MNIRGYKFDLELKGRERGMSSFGGGYSRFHFKGKGVKR